MRDLGIGSLGTACQPWSVFPSKSERKPSSSAPCAIRVADERGGEQSSLPKEVTTASEVRMIHGNRPGPKTTRSRKGSHGGFRAAECHAGFPQLIIHGMPN